MEDVCIGGSRAATPVAVRSVAMHLTMHEDGFHVDEKPANSCLEK